MLITIHHTHESVTETAGMTATENLLKLNSVFPEGVMHLQEADPELYEIIRDEKDRQWYVGCILGGGVNNVSDRSVSQS